MAHQGNSSFSYNVNNVKMLSTELPLEAYLFDVPEVVASWDEDGARGYHIFVTAKIEAVTNRLHREGGPNLVRAVAGKEFPNLIKRLVADHVPCGGVRQQIGDPQCPVPRGFYAV